jgi:hypothetical protein
MKQARFVALYHYLLNSEAWRSLDPLSRSIYVELCRRYNGQNNGKISFSVREGAEMFNVGKTTVSRSLGRLIARGFAFPTKKGAFSLKMRHATEWRLADYPADGQPATKDFMRWSRPKNQNAVSVVGLTIPLQVPNGTRRGTDVA